MRFFDKAQPNDNADSDNSGAPTTEEEARAELEGMRVNLDKMMNASEEQIEQLAKSLSIKRNCPCPSEGCKASLPDMAFRLLLAINVADRMAAALENRAPTDALLEDLKTFDTDVLAMLLFMFAQRIGSLSVQIDKNN